ncbi:unnamed protein product [Bursaphelenchus xylophilus]|nr:unnamed protein product [Bursaphelenchus xylophilus]CAG9119138.1 unnamed protein product [Bursaphelenchus xylophilus]
MAENEVHNRRPNIILAVLVAMFGSTSWLGPDAFWVEQGIHTQKLPEGWSLGATLTIIIQVSALVALVYTILESYNVKMKKAPLIILALLVNLCAFIPMGFFNEVSIEVAGKQRSIVLYVAMFFIGAVAILSDVLFLPYMKNLPEVYFQAYFFGIGLSSFVPSILSIIQGAATYDCVPSAKNSSVLEPKFENLRFSVEIFYTIVFIWCCLGAFSFILIHFCRSFIDNLWYGGQTLPRSSTDEKIIVITKPLAQRKSIWNGTSDYMLLALITLISGQNNVLLPSIQSFVVLPYSQTTYFWSLALGSIAQPIAAFIAHLAPAKKTQTMAMHSVITITASAICVVLALKSPTPWLVGTTIGSILVIMLTTSVYFFGTYSRCVIFEAIRDRSPSDDVKHRRLLYVGFTSQVGCALGTLFVFPTVNIFELFESVPPC